MGKTENHFEQILKTMSETKRQNNNIELELISFVNIVNELGQSFEEVDHQRIVFQWLHMIIRKNIELTKTNTP